LLELSESLVGFLYPLKAFFSLEQLEEGETFLSKTRDKAMKSRHASRNF
jgi:hypothetical protein